MGAVVGKLAKVAGNAVVTAIESKGKDMIEKTLLRIARPAGGLFAALEAAAELCTGAATILEGVIGSLRKVVDAPDDKTRRDIVSTALDDSLTTGVATLIKVLAGVVKLDLGEFAGTLKKTLGGGLVDKLAGLLSTPIKAAVDRVMTALGFGGKAGPAVAAKDVLVLPKGFTAGGEQHKIWIDAKGSVRVASEEEDLGKMLDVWKRRAMRFVDKAPEKKVDAAKVGYDQLETALKRQIALNVKLSAAKDKSEADVKAAAAETAKANSSFATCHGLIMELYPIMESGPVPLLEGELDVGSYAALSAKEVDSLQAHHVPSRKYIEKTLGVPERRTGTPDSDVGASIQMYQPSTAEGSPFRGRRKGRHSRTKSFGPTTASPAFKEMIERSVSQAVTADTQNIRDIYQEDKIDSAVVEAAITKLIDLIKAQPHTEQQTVVLMIRGL